MDPRAGSKSFPAVAKKFNTTDQTPPSNVKKRSACSENGKASTRGDLKKTHLDRFDSQTALKYPRVGSKSIPAVEKIFKMAGRKYEAVATEIATKMAIEIATAIPARSKHDLNKWLVPSNPVPLPATQEEFSTSTAPPASVSPPASPGLQEPVSASPVSVHAVPAAVLALLASPLSVSEHASRKQLMWQKRKREQFILKCKDSKPLSKPLEEIKISADYSTAADEVSSDADDVSNPDEGKRDAAEYIKTTVGVVTWLVPPPALPPERESIPTAWIDAEGCGYTNGMQEAT